MLKWSEVKEHRTIKLPEKALLAAEALRPHVNEKAGSAPLRMGGTIKNGEWAWMVSGALLQVTSLRNGQILSSFEFAESKGFNNSIIKCIEEIQLDGMDASLLAIGLDTSRGTTGNSSYNFVALYSIELNALLTCIELPLHVCSLAFLGATECRRTLLQQFDGCIAIGAVEGFVIMLDLNIRSLITKCEQHFSEDYFGACHIVALNSLAISDIQRAFQQCRQENKHFGIKLEVIDGPLCPITCIHPIGATLGLAIGLRDGRLVLYDLVDMQIFHITDPRTQTERAPIVKMDHLEPADDPRFCVYICAMHEDEQQLTALLHQVVYEKRMSDEEFESFYYEGFQRSYARLELPLERSGTTMALGCQSIFKEPMLNEEDAAISLCALSWHCLTDKKTKLLILDLNQWYKEEMPHVVLPNKAEHFLAGYTLSGNQNALHVYVNPLTIVSFHAIQRFEEHFYPNSLSFECSLLMSRSCRSYSCVGVQYKLINTLRYSNAAIFLEPEFYFELILNARLLPQFCELNATATFSKHSKYVAILSVALENNCYSLLRDCAKSWCDGSFMGGFASSTDITLSTLTEWIWTRSKLIKRRCNDICSGLFDTNACPLDQREKQELGMLTKQLKMLAELLSEVLAGPKSTIPAEALYDMKTRHSLLLTNYEYQEILLWLLNIGLLPESLYFHRSISGGLMTFPFHELRMAYANKRAFFKNKNENFISKKTGSCRLIFIDAFLDHKCQSDTLAEKWSDNGGDGLYPPTSMEAMLRVLHVPHMDFKEKCAILLYFFLDLHAVLRDKGVLNTSVVESFIKFPSVFKLPPATAKTVEAFWNLDQCCFLLAVDNFISPFNKNKIYPEWMAELLIESLLTQGQPNCALRVLEACPTLISPVLQLKTLLANQLISEAFHLARDKHDDLLMEQFFLECLQARHYDVVRELALSDNEGRILQRILRSNKTRLGESLSFVYLLQKFQYIDASTYMDELQSQGHNLMPNERLICGGEAMDTPQLVMSAFNTTRAPLTQRLTDVYFRIRNKIKRKEADVHSPLPLSCQLIKHNANDLLGGIYHSSALSAHMASHYWGETGNERKQDPPRLVKSHNAPFLRKAQPEMFEGDFVEKNEIAYPQPYQVVEKRTHQTAELNNSNELGDEKQQPSKRRRLLGEEFISDLKHFRPTQHREISSPVITAKNSKVKEKERLSCILNPSPEERRSKAAVNVELHGILKTNTPEPSNERSAVRRGTPMDEEKCLRFRLPVGVSSKDSSTDDEEDNKFNTDGEDKQNRKNIEDHNEYKEDIEETQQEKIAEPTEGYKYEKTCDYNFKVMSECQPEPESEASVKVIYERSEKSPIRRKTVTCAISANESDANDSTEEDFFSPVSSPKNLLQTEVAQIVDTLDTPSASPRIICGPQPRKPLSSVSPETKPSIKTRSSHSSGFGSFGDDKPSTSTAALKPASTLASRMLDFVPPSCSSRVSETHAKFLSERQSSQIKITERSTIVGGLTFVESNVKVSSQRDETSAVSPIERARLLDTTLGMSSYDLDVTAQLNLGESSNWSGDLDTNLLTTLSNVPQAEIFSVNSREEESSNDVVKEDDEGVEGEEESVDEEEEAVDEEEDGHEEEDDDEVGEEEEDEEGDEDDDDDDEIGVEDEDLAVPGGFSVSSEVSESIYDMHCGSAESTCDVSVPSSEELSEVGNVEFATEDESSNPRYLILPPVVVHGSSSENLNASSNSVVSDDVGESVRIPRVENATEPTKDNKHELPEPDSTIKDESTSTDTSSEDEDDSSDDPEEDAASEAVSSGSSDTTDSNGTTTSEQNHAITEPTEHRPAVVVPVAKNDEDHCFDVSSTDLNNEDSNETSSTAHEVVANVTGGATKEPIEESKLKAPTTEPVKEAVAGTGNELAEGPLKGPTARLVKAVTMKPEKEPTEWPEKGPTERPVKDSNAGPVKGVNAVSEKEPTAGPVKDVNVVSEKEATQGPVKEAKTELVKDSVARPEKEPQVDQVKTSTEGLVKNAKEESVKEPTAGSLIELTVELVKRAAAELKKEPTQYHVKEATAGPVKEPIAAPFKDKIAEPIMKPTDPIKRATSEAEEEPTQDPVKEATAGPISAPCKEKLAEPIMKPMDPVKRATAESDQVKERTAGSVKLRPDESVKEPTARPLTELTVDPIKRATTEPEKEPIGDPVKEAIAGLVKEQIAAPSKEELAQPIMKRTDPVKRGTAQSDQVKESTAVSDKQRIADPLMELTVDPIKRATAEPEKEPIGDPVKETIAGPVKEPIAAPSKEKLAEPIMKRSNPVKHGTAQSDQVKEPTAGAVKEPPEESVKEPTAGRLTELTVDPVKCATSEPEKESTEDLVKETIAGLVKEPITKASQNLLSKELDKKDVELLTKDSLPQEWSTINKYNTVYARETNVQSDDTNPLKTQQENQEKEKYASMSDDELVLRFEEEDCLPQTPEKAAKIECTTTNKRRSIRGGSMPHQSPQSDAVAQRTRRALSEVPETVPLKRAKIGEVEVISSKPYMSSATTPTLTRLRRRTMTGESVTPTPDDQIRISEESVSTPRRGRRSLAVDDETSTPPRQTRARSVLSTVTLESDTPKKRNSTRAQSGVSTPDRNARAASILSEAGSDKLTPARQTRAQSVASTADSGKSQTTPHRKTRAQSIVSTAGSDKSQSTPARKTRGQSILSSVGSDSPESKPRRITRTKIPHSTDAATDSTQSKSESKSGEEAAESYQASRRLTRTQLAMMQKTEMAKTSSDKETKAMPPKRRRATPIAATSQHDSDESLASTSNARHMKLRGSVKDEQEEEDDTASQTSSVGSRQSIRLARSKNSPAVTLPPIQEDEAAGLAPKRSRTKH